MLNGKNKTLFLTAVFTWFLGRFDRVLLAYLNLMGVLKMETAGFGVVYV